METLVGWIIWAIQKVHASLNAIDGKSPQKIIGIRTKATNARELAEKHVNRHIHRRGSVLKGSVPKTLAFAFGSRLRSKTQRSKTRVLERRLPMVAI